MDIHLKKYFTRFQEQFGSGPGLGPGSETCLLKIDGISQPFVKSLYKAAASLYRTDPWRRLRPAHLFRVKAGKDFDWQGRKQPFPFMQFIGGDGGDLGIYMYKSREDAQKMTGFRETIKVPNVELMRVTYEAESLMFDSHKRIIDSLSLEMCGEDRFPVFDVVRCNSCNELEFRNPTIDELRFVYAVMRAFALIHPLLEEDCSNESSSGLTRFSRLTCFKPFIETVDIQWTSEMAKSGDRNELVAVTVSHPPNRGYQENVKNSEEKEEPFD